MLESPHPIAAVATSKRRRSRCVAASRTPRRTTAPVVGSLASRWIETWRGTRSHTRTRCAISHPRATAIGSLRMDASGTSSGSSPARSAPTPSAPASATAPSDTPRVTVSSRPCATASDTYHASSGPERSARSAPCTTAIATNAIAWSATRSPPYIAIREERADDEHRARTDRVGESAGRDLERDDGDRVHDHHGPDGREVETTIEHQPHVHGHEQPDGQPAQRGEDDVATSRAHCVVPRARERVQDDRDVLDRALRGGRLGAIALDHRVELRVERLEARPRREGASSRSAPTRRPTRGPTRARRRGAPRARSGSGGTPRVAVRSTRPAARACRGSRPRPTASTPARRATNARDRRARARAPPRRSCTRRAGAGGS